MTEKYNRKSVLLLLGEILHFSRFMKRNLSDFPFLEII